MPATKRKTADKEEPVKESTKGVFNEKQQLAIDAAVTHRQNVFLTGSAGVGKSFVLREIITLLRQTLRVGVTGSTGIAAIQIGGVTLYSLFGLSPIMITKNIMKHNEAWKEIDCLVIDEVSMLQPDLFVYLDMHARRSRGNNELFGGVQLILVGDFFQLPPVHKNGPPVVTFAFELPIWKKLFEDDKGVAIELNDVYRQQDREFVELLERVRKGELFSSDSMKLGLLSAAQPAGYVKLFGRCANVDECNNRELRRLEGEAMRYQLSFKAESAPGKKPFASEELAKYEKETLNNLTVNSILELKEKALVMLVANVCPEMGLANGSCGVVDSFDADGLPIVKFESTTVKVRPYDWVVQLGPRGKMTATGIPLKLAYAITIHKSQGQTIDKLFVDLANVWEYGQAYTSLSRAKSMQHLVVNNFTKECVKAHPKVLAFYQSIAHCA